MVANGDGTITWTLGQLVGVDTLTGAVSDASDVTQTVTLATTPASADHVDIDEIAETR